MEDAHAVGELHGLQQLVGDSEPGRVVVHLLDRGVEQLGVGAHGVGEVEPTFVEPVVGEDADRSALQPTQARVDLEDAVEHALFGPNRRIELDHQRVSARRSVGGAKDPMGGVLKKGLGNVVTL